MWYKCIPPVHRNLWSKHLFCKTLFFYHFWILSKNFRLLFGSFQQLREGCVLQVFRKILSEKAVPKKTIFFIHHQQFSDIEQKIFGFLSKKNSIWVFINALHGSIGSLWEKNSGEIIFFSLSLSVIKLSAFFWHSFGGFVRIVLYVSIEKNWW